MTFTRLPSPAVAVHFRMRGSEFFNATRADEPPRRPVYLHPVTHLCLLATPFTKPFADALRFQSPAFKIQLSKPDGLPVFTVVGRGEVAVFKPVDQLCPAERKARVGRGFGQLVAPSGEFV